MVCLTIEFWEVVLDVIGLCLCGITIIYLIRNKARFKEVLSRKRKDDDYTLFDKALLVQVLKQQPEKSFETILNTFNKELRNTKGLYTRTIEEEQNQEISNVKGGIDDSGAEGSTVDIYGQVVRMADLGMTPKKISEKVSLPKPEIDLIINLVRKGYRSAA